MKQRVFIFILAILIIFISIISLGPVLKPNNMCLYGSEKLGIHVGMPNCTGIHSTGGPPVEAHLNSYGFRDKERKKNKPGRTRIALLGGSTSYGVGLPDEQSPSWLVEDLLKKTGGAHIELMNLSTLGYQTVRHSLRITEYINEFKPDIIIVDGQQTNKIFRDFVDWQAADFDNQGELIKLTSMKEFIGKKPYKFLKSRRNLMSWGVQIYNGYRFFNAYTTLYWNKLHGKSFESLLLEPQRRSFQHMQAACVKRCKLYVLWDPVGGITKRSGYGAGLLPDSDHSLDTIRDLLEKLSVDILDIQDSLPRAEEDNFFQGTTQYYNAAGMRRYAMALVMAINQIIKQRKVTQ